MDCNKQESHEELMELYRQWAKDYDKDVAELRGYIGPEVAVTAFVKAVGEHQLKATCKILDVGAGTGLVAKELRKHGFCDIDGLDSSAEMLDVAREHSLYTKYILDELKPGRELQIQADSYDCAIACGLFTVGHVKGEGAMDEIARVVKRGGLVCFTVREDALLQEETYGYQAKMKDLCERNIWKLLSLSRETYHNKFDHAKCSLYLYQIL